MNDAKELFVYNLKRLLNSRGETQADLARGLGKTESTVSDWAKGKTLPRAGTLQDIAKYFDVNISDLTALPSKKYENNPLKQRLNAIFEELTKSTQQDVVDYAQAKLDEQEHPRVPIKIVPIDGYSAAGTAPELYGADTTGETISTDKLKADASVVLTGDSMEPKFHQGEPVFYRYQPNIENGDLAIVEIDGEGAICKQVKFDYNNRKIILHSLNPKYDDIIVEPTRIRILGKVID